MAAKRKYKWEEWFSKPSAVLVRGVDYNVSQVSMWQQIHNRSKFYAVRVKVTDLNDRMLIEIIGVRDEGSHTNEAAFAV